MLATLQDAGAGSRRRFVREIADFVRWACGPRIADGERRRAPDRGRRPLPGGGLAHDAGRQHAAVPAGPRHATTRCSPRHRSPCSQASSQWRSSATTGSPAPARWCGPRCACRPCGTTTPGSSTWRPSSFPSSVSASWCSLHDDARPTPGAWRGCWCRPPSSRRPGRRRARPPPSWWPACCSRHSSSSWRPSRCCRPTRALPSPAPSR